MLKVHREILRALEAEGIPARVEYSRRHARVIIEAGGRSRWYAVPVTPSCSRNMPNTITACRRIYADLTRNSPCPTP